MNFLKFIAIVALCSAFNASFCADAKRRNDAFTVQCDEQFKFLTGCNLWGNGDITRVTIIDSSVNGGDDECGWAEYQDWSTYHQRESFNHVIGNLEPQSKKLACVHRLEVRQQFQGRGLGRKLFDKVVQELQAKGYDKAIFIPHVITPRSGTRVTELSQAQDFLQRMQCTHLVSPITNVTQYAVLNRDSKLVDPYYYCIPKLDAQPSLPDNAVQQQREQLSTESRPSLQQLQQQQSLPVAPGEISNQGSNNRNPSLISRLISFLREEITLRRVGFFAMVTTALYLHFKC